MGQRTTDRLDGEGRRIVPHVEGHVILLYDRDWEDEYGLLPVSEPLPVEEWIAATCREGYSVEWTPQGAIAEGPYRGGVVVEIDDDRSRSYVAVPPELLDRLRELMDEQDYRMVREDVTALDNPEPHGLRVSRLDPAAWEERHHAVPTKELPMEGWARAIRDNGLQVEMTYDGSLPIESSWPGGHVITTTDGVHRYYFAVPRGALNLAIDLSLEMEGAAAAAGASASASAAVAGF